MTEEGLSVQRWFGLRERRRVRGPPGSAPLPAKWFQGGSAPDQAGILLGSVGSLDPGLPGVLKDGSSDPAPLTTPRERTTSAFTAFNRNQVTNLPRAWGRKQGRVLLKIKGTDAEVIILKNKTTTKTSVL